MNSVVGLLRRLRRLGRIAGREDGMALPAAMFATLAATALAGAAVVSSVDVQQGSHRDSASKQAIAAADAGASVALERLNRYASALSSASSSSCLGVTAGVLVATGPEADGWCPPIEGTVGTAAYSYRATPVTTGSSQAVVSTGSDGTVSRRIKVALSRTSVGGLFDGVGVISDEDLNLYNSAYIDTGIGTNGNVTLYNSATICGDIRHGEGKTVTYYNSAGQCNSYGVTEGKETPPPVSSFMPEDIASHNSNARLAKCEPWLSRSGTPANCELDYYSAKNSHTWGWFPGNASHPGSIELSNATLSLGGEDYFVCRLILNNGSVLYMAAGAHVRIFFDTPEHCGLAPGASQIELNNSSNIQATGYESEYAVLGLYVQGSTTQSTTVAFNNNTGSNQLDLYAPNSQVSFNNKATFKGSVVGKRVTLYNNVKIERDDGYEPPDIGGTKIYARASYVECSGGAAVAVPDENC